MKNKIENLYNKYEEKLHKLNTYMYENPELGRKEVIGIETAFIASYKSKKDGPKIAFLAEYDALPEIGHGCGHNILGTASTGAGLVLKDIIDELGGEVYVYGTPAEETDGAKVDMSKAGLFDHIDIALAVHPTGKCHMESGTSQAMEAIRFEFHGKTAHAAGGPQDGINALDGVLTLFNSINAMRQQVKDGDRIHGIISNGGEAANIIPDYAAGDFYVRSNTKKNLDTLVERVKNCAKGAAIATGTTVDISNYEYTFEDLVTNKKLSEIYIKHLKDLGVEKIGKKDGKGSTDMGNVSYCCPVIHPYFPISKNKLIGHSVEFAKATQSVEAKKGMKEAIYAMVLTSVDVIQNKELLDEIKSEFESMDK